ncbi:MAG: hypothetical protein DCC56_04260 [Anaerolineae bacterium]|nr:MAG: hypothetical protein DCC56_04260 [Anaerolineae bacterium]WKZ43939.1 MAG: hypothetical protein QY302_17720 [Anaerolineales bacterium]
MQHTFRTKTLITKDGKISIKGLPFRTGETVEVTVRRGKKPSRAAKYPLRGKTVVYRDPFKGVAVNDWESAR